MTALILLGGTVMSAFFYMRNRESTLYQIRELVVRDAVSMGARVQANIDGYQRSVAAVQEVVSRAPSLSHDGFLKVLASTSPSSNARGCVFVVQKDKKSGASRVVYSHGNFSLDFAEGSLLGKSIAAPALEKLMAEATPEKGLATLVRLPSGPNSTVPALVVIEPEERGGQAVAEKPESRTVIGVYSFNDLVDQALDPTTMHGYDVIAYQENARGQNEVIYFNQANYQDELTPFNLDTAQNFATQRYRMPVGDSVAFIAFTPTTEWLSRNESPLPQVVLMLGLSMTCVLATLYVYKSRRASLVQDLVEQRTAELAIANLRLDESRGTLSSLLEACPDAINGKDNQGRWTFANRAFLQLAGLPETFPYRGLKDDDVVQRAKPTNSKFLKLRADLDSQVIFDGQALRREMTIEAPNQPRRHLDIHMMPVRGNDGGIVGLVAVYNDISELRRRINALQQSRERVKLLVQNTATAIVEWDDRLRVLHWNPAAARLFGYDAEEIRDKPIAFFADPETQEESAKALESFLREQDKTIPQVFRHRSRRGHNLTCEWQNTPIIDEEGRPLGVTSFIYDVTERTKAEQALRKRDGILRGLAGSAAGFLSSDAWEPEAAELLRHLVDSLTLSRVCLVRTEDGENGLDAHTLLEWLNPFWDGTPLLHAEGSPGADKDPHQDICRAGLHAHLIANGETFGPCDAMPASWGSALATQGTCSVLLLPLRIEGSVWGFLRFDDCRLNREWTADEVDALRVVGAVMAGAIARQILSKERLQMEKRLLLSQKRESLGLLAGGIARDFNNLVNEILGNASLGRTLAETDSSIDSCLASIEEHGLRAAALCHQMQSYSGHGEAQAGLASPNLIILDVINGIDPEHHRRIHFRKDLANGIPIIEVDVDQIRQAIHSVVHNAIEAIGNQAGLIEIQTRPAPGTAGIGEGAEITIRDTGPGMTPQVRDRMFDPFFSTKMTGRGLGLTIAQSIVEAHGGTIQVESNPGSGTLVKILLPSRRAQPVVLAGPAPALPTMSGTVLVVHDGRPIGHATALAFQQLGFATESCLGVDQAMHHLISYPDRYCLVAVDPNAPGAEAATLQRLRLASYNSAVILLTDGDHCPTGLRHFADEGLAVLLPGELSADSLRGAVTTALKLR